jgi:hypothetical protein
MVSVARTSRGLLSNIDRGVSNGQFRRWSGGIWDGESVPVIYEQCPYLHSLKSERRFDCFPFASNLAQTASKLNGKLSPNSGKLGIDNPVA